MFKSKKNYSPTIEALAHQQSTSACKNKRTHDGNRHGRNNAIKCLQEFQRMGTLAPSASGCDWLTANFR